MFKFLKLFFTTILYLLNVPVVSSYNISNNCDNIAVICNKRNFILFNQELTIDMFYTTFATVIYFSTICVVYSLIYCTKYRRLLKRNMRLFGYKSIGTLAFILLFSIWTVVTIIYAFMTDDIGDTLFRLGIWIIINMIFILIPIPRNNIFVDFLRLSHSEIVFIHSYIAILCMLSVVIKFIVVMLYFPPKFLIILVNLQTGGSPLAGTLATFFIILTGIFSIPYIKNNCYEVFNYTHRILTVLSFIATICHYNICILYLALPTLLYVYDLVQRCRCINKVLYLKLIKCGYVVINVTISKVNIHVPGSYFLICFRNISYLQWHPFSLVKQNKNILTFCIKDVGNNSWTSKLTTMSSNFVENAEIYIQGPYSYFDIDYILSRYVYIICICGGIGVTPIFSILDHIIKLTYLKKINLKKVVFIWSVSDVSLIDYFDINNLMNTQIIDIEIYVTKQKINNHPSYIKEGRPDLKKLVDVFIKMNKVNIDRLCILSSGPKSLMDNVKSIGIDYNIDNFCEEF